MCACRELVQNLCRLLPTGSNRLMVMGDRRGFLQYDRSVMDPRTTWQGGDIPANKKAGEELENMMGLEKQYMAATTCR